MKNLFITTLISLTLSVNNAGNYTERNYNLYSGNYINYGTSYNSTENAYFSYNQINYKDMVLSITGRQTTLKYNDEVEDPLDGNETIQAYTEPRQLAIYKLNWNQNYNAEITVINNIYKPQSNLSNSYEMQHITCFLPYNQYIETMLNSETPYWNINQILDMVDYLQLQDDPTYKESQVIFDGTGTTKQIYDVYTPLQINDYTDYAYYIEYWYCDSYIYQIPGTYIYEPFINIQLKSIQSDIKPVAPTTTEIIDVPGMLFDIIMMPWRFISIAFNLTIFPGTPYSINFTNLIAGVFGVILSFIVVKIIFKVIK